MVVGYLVSARADSKCVYARYDWTSRTYWTLETHVTFECAKQEPSTSLCHPIEFSLIFLLDTGASWQYHKSQFPIGNDSIGLHQCCLWRRSKIAQAWSNLKQPVAETRLEESIYYLLFLNSGILICAFCYTLDRLELDGGKIVVGDFQSFQGQPEDRETLKLATRSAVKALAMTHRRGWASHVLGEYRLIKSSITNFYGLSSWISSILWSLSVIIICFGILVWKC